MIKLLEELATEILHTKDNNKITKLVLKIISLKRMENNLIGNWHPLGFVHFKLGSVQNIGDVRLHIWSNTIRKTQDPEMPIHNHVYTVNSHILIGNVTNKLYKTISGNYSKIYNVSYDNHRSFLISSEQPVGYELVHEKTYRSGENYSVVRGEFHESIVRNDEFAATIVVATDKINGAAITLGPKEGSKIYKYKRELCDKVTINQVISILSDKLFTRCGLFVYDEFEDYKSLRIR